jgi:predicted permease
LLTESSLLALLGGCFGLLLALWGVDLLIAVIPASRLAYMPYLRNPSLNAEVLLFTFGLSLLTGILFGLTPALDASQPDLQVAMKEGAKSSSSKTTGRLRSVLVVSELALALILLVGAGLFMKSLIRMLSVDPGFRTENLLTMKFSIPPGTYSDDVKLSAAHDDLLQRVESLLGVKGVATVSSLPLSGDGGTGTPQIVGRPPVSGSDWGESFLRTVSPGYFNVMGVPLVKGRLFTDRDGPSTPNAVIINQTLADLVFPGEESVGQHITFMFTADQPPFEIVGVVGDEKVKSLDASTAPVIYFPFRQGPESTVSLVVRTTTDPQSMAAAVRNEVQSIDKEIPLYSVMTMEKLISNAPATFMRRYPAYLIGVFAAVALVLAVVGIYGVISYSVSQRAQEIAIRVALGAQQIDILRLILSEGMLLAFLGIAIGLVGAVALTRLLSNLLFAISASDPGTYAAVSGILAVVALLACYLPARRAMKVDPIAVLRYE